MRVCLVCVCLVCNVSGLLPVRPKGNHRKGWHRFTRETDAVLSCARGQEGGCGTAKAGSEDVWRVIGCAFFFFLVHTDGGVFDKSPSVVTFATGCKYVLLLEFAACCLVVRPPACVSGWLSFAVFALLPN